MLYETLQTQIKKLKYDAIYSITSETHDNLIGIDEIYCILPHRDPFVLLDTITSVDLSQQAIKAHRKILANDPVFKGHFPNNPIYPGVLQVEMMGQAALCLAYFIKENTAIVRSDAKPIKSLFTKIHHTAFLDSILPNETVDIIAKMHVIDDLLGIALCQLIKNNKIISYSILEVYFDE